jgi:hypothetical protein
MRRREGVTPNGAAFVLTSSDLRWQILATLALLPRCLRDSPINALADAGQEAVHNHCALKTSRRWRLIQIAQPSVTSCIQPVSYPYNQHRYLAGQLGRFASSFAGAHVSDFLSKIDEPGQWTRNLVRQIPTCTPLVKRNSP